MNLVTRSPMLAPGKVPDLKKLRYPLLASLKMDGVRCLLMEGELISRTGKRIPNIQLKKKLMPELTVAHEDRMVVDGELWTPKHPFNLILGACMSKNSHECFNLDVGFHAFDSMSYQDWNDGKSDTYVFRYAHIPHGITKVEQIEVRHHEQLEELYQQKIDEGHEGLIVRTGSGRYKWGRCTSLEHNMFKLKAVEELDCEVIGFECLKVMTEDAEREVNELGRMKAVHRQEFKQDSEQLGTLLVRDERNREFRVGSGFTQGERVYWWNRREELVGKWVKIKYAQAGEKDLPRHPVFISFRDPK